MLIVANLICNESCTEFVDYRMTIDCIIDNQSEETISIEVSKDKCCIEDYEMLTFVLLPGESKSLENLNFGAKEAEKLERWHTPYYNYGATIIIGEKRIEVKADHSLESVEQKASICDAFNYVPKKLGKSHFQVTYTFDDTVCQQLLNNF